MRPKRDLEVQVEYLPTDQGGRRSPAHSGYRPQLYYDGHDWDALHEYPDVEMIFPGSRTRAYLVCLSPQFHDGKLIPGTPVLFREGRVIVAFGAVSRIIDLPVSAFRARISEALDPYYMDIAAAVDACGTEPEKEVWRQHLQAAAALRNALRLGHELPDLHEFLIGEREFLRVAAAHDGMLAEGLASLEEIAETEPPPTLDDQ